MTVRDALLGLLAAGPRHGYQLKAEFDSATGSVWPLNIGQVYSTLQRLEKAGLIEPEGDADDDGRRAFRLSESGHEAVADWMLRPKSKLNAVRDEVSLKVLIAMAVGAIAIDDVLEAQRAATMSVLQTLTRMKAESPPTAVLPGASPAPHGPAEELAWTLHLDRLIMMAEAEVRWLDLTEQRLRHHPPDHPQPAETEPTVTQRASDSTGPAITADHANQPRDPDDVATQAGDSAAAARASDSATPAARSEAPQS